MTFVVPRAKAGLIGAVAMAAALAGCETYGGGGAAATRQFAVVETDSTGATNVNIASLTEVIQRNPNDAGAYVTRGAAYARSGQFNDAIGDFSKAVQIDPNSASAYNNRALAYRQTGRNDAALADFSKAISADPSYGPAYIGRANVLRAQGDLDGATSDLNQAIRLTPESAEAYHARGLVRQRQGQNTQAIGDFDARHRPQSLRRRALRRARPEPHRHEPVRQGDRGLQRGPQRQQQGRHLLGLSRSRLREVEPQEGGDGELPAGRSARARQSRGQAGPRTSAGRA